MGSTAELREATQFAAEHKIRPIVSAVLDGLENAEKGFEMLAAGKEVSLSPFAIRLPRRISATLMGVYSTCSLGRLWLGLIRRRVGQNSRLGYPE